MKRNAAAVADLASTRHEFHVSAILGHLVAVPLCIPHPYFGRFVVYVLFGSATL